VKESDRLAMTAIGQTSCCQHDDRPARSVGQRPVARCSPHSFCRFAPLPLFRACVSPVSSCGPSVPPHEPCGCSFG
jgi:hypothetical protein